MEDTAEMSNDGIKSSDKNKAGNFKTKPTGTGDSEIQTSGAGDFHQDGNRTGDKREGGGQDEDEKGNARPKKQVKEDTGKTTKDKGAGAARCSRTRKRPIRVSTGVKDR